MSSQPIRLPSGNDPVRPCGKCTVCCTVLAIDELEKPFAVACPHLSARGGCGQYEQRPNACRKFDCVWRKGLGSPRMRPDKCGVMFMASDDGNALVGIVNGQRPGLWRKGETQAIIDWHVAHGVPVFIVDHGRRHSFMPTHSHLSQAVLDRLQRWFDGSRLG